MYGGTGMDRADLCGNYTFAGAAATFVAVSVVPFLRWCHKVPVTLVLVHVKQLVLVAISLRIDSFSLSPLGSH